MSSRAKHSPHPTRERADAKRHRRAQCGAAAEALFALMDRAGFDLDLDAVDQLNRAADAPPAGRTNGRYPERDAL